MSMPWDTPPSDGQPNNYPPPGQPYVPPAGQPYPPATPYSSQVPPYQPPAHLPPQGMQPDVPPVVARNPQTGETVSVNIGTDLREAIRQAITQSVVENKDALQANAQRALVKKVQGEQVSVSAPTPAALAGGELEGDFEMGPATKRTLLQGLAVDMGFAAMTAVGMATAGDFDFTDPEQWSLLGVLMLKTLIQTGMSYVMRLKVD